MHLTKENSRQVLNSYMFWHRDAILRELFYNKGLQVQHANLGIA